MTVVAIITELTVMTVSVVNAVTFSSLIVTHADRFITVTMALTRHTTCTVDQSYHHVTILTKTQPHWHTDTVEWTYR